MFNQWRAIFARLRRSRIRLFRQRIRRPWARLLGGPMALSGGAAESAGPHARPFNQPHQPNAARSDQPSYTGTRGRSSVLGTQLTATHKRNPHEESPRCPEVFSAIRLRRILWPAEARVPKQIGATPATTTSLARAVPAGREVARVEVLVTVAPDP